ncbi:HlyD family type I secretion periplasmic adaptor subunit [Aliihoeflea aestuarii]|uniref:HlyD family type I secretion periplasmic adaptor subunit n=1 Tax=Aliihoeflea aestuarii TaxID=453840 RepID=UPI002092C866|nr:HlyD family type I secretion periplasmic adaptor subunit [Aliihoeflea aestuarii]MCO6390876.1 HlyD family type I secretion periplasmic adaptor subunit [Aliihoeflea aestuarii]
MLPPTQTRSIYSDPWRPARWGVAAIVGFVVLLALWGSAAPLAGAVIANGSFEVEGRRQSVQHPYGGVVTELLVTEGQTVERGDVLVRLSPSEPQAQYDVLQGSNDALRARRARLIAERQGDVTPTFPDDLNERGDAGRQLIENELSLFEARSRQHAANVDLVEQRMAQLREQAEGIETQIDGLDRQAASLEEETVGARRLLDEGFAPRSRVVELERSIDEVRTQAGVRRSELMGVQESISEARLEIARLEQERLSEVTEQLQQTDTALADNRPKLEAAGDILARSQIRAPASGRVVGLSVFTEGGVIEAGTRLMDVVPSGTPLFVEAQLRLIDIGDVEAGQIADVRLVGMPRDVRPKLSATIRNISPDSLNDQATGEQYYALQLALEADEVASAGMELQPGMPVQVVIETRPRTLVGYLTSPLLDEVSGAFRER